MQTTRRDFIKNVGLAGVAAMSMPGILSAQNFNKLHSGGKNEKGLTFLFQGDSITDGNRTRDKDWNHIMGHGYACLIASRLWYDYPDKNLMFINRGVSGNRVRDLDARWQQDTIDLQPDVISILIGVNDVIALVQNNDPEPIGKYEQIFNGLLDKTMTELPNSMLVLMEPFILPLGWVNQKTEVWLKEIPARQEVVKRSAQKYGAVFVELQKYFDVACKKAPAGYWIWDGVHPMPAGHELIARRWINDVGKKLTFMDE